MEIAQEQGFRPINLEFLTTRGEDHFDIYYKAKSFGSVRFVKFASSSPTQQGKVRRLMESGEFLEEFYIHEEDLFKYYKHATQTLRGIVTDSNVSFQKKTEKVYEVSKNIMKEFFEYNASDKILHSSEEVMEVMEECFKDADSGFYGIAQITNKDYYTYTHSVNVGLYCMTYGVKVNLRDTTLRELGMGGMLHDVGKSKIPLDIIDKKGRLTPEEFEEIKKHAPYGKDILTEMDCYGKRVIQMADQHHEKFSGGGYPNGLAGKEISLFSRVCKVMDVYDALTTRRSYKKAMSAYDTLILMKKQMVDDFDPEILDNFINFMGPEL